MKGERKTEEENSFIYIIMYALMKQYNYQFSN